jgi:hypothetical protein
MRMVRPRVQASVHEHEERTLSFASVIADFRAGQPLISTTEDRGIREHPSIAWSLAGNAGMAAQRAIGPEGPANHPKHNR